MPLWEYLGVGSGRFEVGGFEGKRRGISGGLAGEGFVDHGLGEVGAGGDGEELIEDWG